MCADARSHYAPGPGSSYARRMASCSQCGSGLPESARFCPACGTAVVALRGEERKVVTILFADLVDSTVLGDNRDPEELRAAVRPQIARMRTELERFSGTFEKYVGDAVMAVFGAPVAHEDDAERAVRAALAIRDAIAGVKVAVNTGEAVVQLEARSGAEEGIATGDVVTTTFRIEEAADPASVLVGESTFLATRGAIEYGDRRVLQAKGKAHPVAVYEAHRAMTERRPAYDRPPLAPLVGRKEELALILDTLARARRDRTVQLVTLVGVPGIGKSRLVWELQRALADEPSLVTWRRGRCLPYGDGVTYWALGEMVKAQAGILETDDGQTAAAKLGRSARDVVGTSADAGWVESHLRPLLALEGDAGRERDEAFAAWRRYFEALAEPAPLVLVFEDLHWADEGLLDFIDHIADWAMERPIVLLCTARPEFRDRRTGWGARTNAATILLPPLSPAETATLLELLLRQTRVPQELRRAVLSRAEGNPLYAEEFVGMLVDRGLLVRNGGDWALRSHDLPLPDSVQAIVAARLDALPVPEKAVLRDASVVGRGFWPKAVAAICGFVTEDVHAHLRSLDLAAEWIEALGRPEDHSETIAHHYLQALEYARNAGQDESVFAERAQSALREAGDRALALNSFKSAERYYAASVDLLPADAPPELLFRLGTARFHAVGTGGEVLERARAQLLERGDVERAAEAEVMLAEATWMQGHGDVGLTHLEHAAALLRDAPATRSKAYVLCSLARFLRNAGRDEEAIEVGREALAMAERLGLDDLCANALCTLGVARAETGDLGGVEDLERSIVIAQAAGSPESVRALLNLGSILARLGDLPRAFALHAEGHQAAERFGDLGGIRWLQAERLYADYWSGRTDDALRRAEDIVGEIEAGTSHRMELDARLIRGWIRLERGDVTEAKDDAGRALEFARVAGDPEALFPALAFAARVAVAAGHEAEGKAIVDELLRSWDEWNLALPSAGLADLGIVAHDVGRSDELFRIASTKTATRWLDAALAVAKGEFTQASELYRAIGSVPDEETARRRA